MFHFFLSFYSVWMVQFQSPLLFRGSFSTLPLLQPLRKRGVNQSGGRRGEKGRDREPQTLKFAHYKSLYSCLANSRCIHIMGERGKK